MSVIRFYNEAKLVTISEVQKLIQKLRNYNIPINA